MTTPEQPKLPALPEIPLGEALPYSQIRYVDGYPNLYVYKYARAYALQAIKEDRGRMAQLAASYAGDDLSVQAQNIAAAIRNQPLPKE